MEDVSDPPFRAVCKENGADLMYTEFISSEGLIRDAMKSRQKLDFFEYERPFGIQIFGVFPLRSRGCAESRHFYDLVAEKNMRQAKSTADQPAIAKQPPHLFGQRICRDVEVFWS